MVVVIVNAASYNLYLYELFWGSWTKTHAKGLYYLITAAVLLYLVIDEIFIYTCNAHFQINLISKFSLILNFLLFYLTLRNLTDNPLLYLFVLNGTIFVLSVIILFSGLEHGYFKQKYEND